MTKNINKKFKRLFRNFKAFSLIELIIVIAIIAILSLAGFLTITKRIGKSRDSRRISDLETIQKALTYNYINTDTNENYPLPDEKKLITGTNEEELWYQGIFGNNTVKNISSFSKAPKDPDGNNYKYSVTTDQKTWEIYAILEEKESIGYIDKTYARKGKIIKRGNYNGYIMGNTGSIDTLYNPASIYITSGTKLTTGSNDYIYQETKNTETSQIVTGMEITDSTIVNEIADTFGITNKEAGIAIDNLANIESNSIFNSIIAVGGTIEKIEKNGQKYVYHYFKNVGTNNFEVIDVKQEAKIDIFLVGGGGGTLGDSLRSPRGGGGGGYTETVKNIKISDKNYEIIVGDGGYKSNGEPSKALGYKVKGGENGYDLNGGDGGSGGGAGRGGSNCIYKTPGNGGSNGSDGSNGDGNPGIGQGNITKEFGESDGKLYAGGGAGSTCYADQDGKYFRTASGGNGGGGNTAKNGEPNTGGGAGGYDGRLSSPTKGGSGIVIIRYPIN